jgi:hypothetical protein
METLPLFVLEFPDHETLAEFYEACATQRGYKPKIQQEGELIDNPESKEEFVKQYFAEQAVSFIKTARANTAAAEARQMALKKAESIKIV